MTSTILTLHLSSERLLQLHRPTGIHRLPYLFPPHIITTWQTDIFLLYVKARLKRVQRNAPFPRQFCHQSTALTLSTAAQCAAQERLRSSRRWKETGVCLPLEPLWTCPVPLCGHTELHTSSFPFCLFQKTTPRFSAGRTASKSAVHTTSSQKGQERKIWQEWKRGGAETEKQ